VVHYITYGRLPDLDNQGRPKFAYSRLIHENCERRPHFDSGRFAEEFGDAGHRAGWCLYRLGCKGPETYANCPAVLFGDAGGGCWPVGTGHPCIGCTEKGVGFAKPIHALAELKFVTPPAFYPRIVEEQGKGGERRVRRSTCWWRRNSRRRFGCHGQEPGQGEQTRTKAGRQTEKEA
jgi:hydrogenase small subunit